MILLFSMIFAHLIADYNLQGILANMKQREWWEKNAPSELYCHDYIVALIDHAFVWTFVVLLPALIRNWLLGIFITDNFRNSVIFLWIFLVNWATHTIVDHLKANEHKINLIQDQTLHFVQILVTFVLWILLFN